MRIGELKLEFSQSVLFLVLSCEIALKTVLVYRLFLVNVLSFVPFFRLAQPLSVLLLLYCFEILATHWAAGVLVTVLLNASIAENVVARFKHSLFNHIILANTAFKLKCSLSSSSNRPLRRNNTGINLLLLLPFLLLLHLAARGSGRRLGKRLEQVCVLGVLGVREVCVWDCVELGRSLVQRTALLLSVVWIERHVGLRVCEAGSSHTWI